MKIQREMQPQNQQPQPQNPQQPENPQQNPRTTATEQPSIAREASMESTSSYNDPPDMNWDWDSIAGNQISPQTTPTSTRTYTARTPEIAPASIQDAAATPPRTITPARTTTPEMQTTTRRPRVQEGTYYESPPEKTTSRRTKGQARQPKPKKV